MSQRKKLSSSKSVLFITLAIIGSYDVVSGLMHSQITDILRGCGLFCLGAFLFLKGNEEYFAGERHISAGAFAKVQLLLPIASLVFILLAILVK